MNTRLLIIMLLLSASRLFAQPCKDFGSLQTSRHWTYQWYDNKQSAVFKDIRRIIAIDETNQRARVQWIIIDRQQDTVFNDTYHIRCTEQGLKVDLLAKLSPDMIAGLAGFMLETDDGGSLWPTNLQAGDSIPAAFSTVKGLQGNVPILEINIATSPSTLLPQESLTTPAGVFPCAVLPYELWITQIVRKRFRLRDWYAQGVGIIRREVFDRNGRFFGYCELLEFSE